MIKKIFAIAAAFGVVAFALPAMAAATPTAAQIACVGSAVNTREQFLDARMTVLTGALNAAYTARASALQQAYTLTTNAAIRTAVNAAWSAFRSATGAARKSWQTSRNSGWTTFRASVKACKAPAVSTDSANSSSEASGL